MSSYSSFTSLENSENDNEYNVNYVYKIIMIGDSGVGKSSIASVYALDVYNPNEDHTIGVSYLTKYVDTVINDEPTKAKVCIWDTAGQERFFSIIKLYFKGVQGICCVYDESNLDTLRNCEKWLNEVRNNVEKNSNGVLPPIILVGNKSDKQDSKNEFHKCQKELLLEYIMNKFDVHHIVCSAKQGINIEKIFEHLLSHMKYKKIKSSRRNPLDIKRENTCFQCNLS